MPTETSLKLRFSNWKHPLLFHFLGMPASFLLTGYFSNFYSGRIQFILLSLFFQIFCGISNYLILKGAFEKSKVSWRDNLNSLAALIVVGALAVSSFAISWQYPGLFDRRIIFMDRDLLLLFTGMAVISTVGAMVLTRRMDQIGISRSINTSSLVQFMQTNLTGILLSLLFLFTYFIFAQSLNFPGHRTLDQYFDVDISEWLTRLTSPPTDEMPTIRAVHPAVMVFLRPAVLLVSIPLNGNTLQAVYLLSALAGASCVFLVWLIVKEKTGSIAYALVIASILGAGTSHLLLSSMLETYIFSALSLIAFCYVLQNGRTSIGATIPLGILIFGITITNLVQACILYFLKLPRIKTVFQFLFAVILTTLLLNMLQVQLFPNAKPLYDPSSLLTERKYKFDLLEAPWRLIGRVKLVSRAVLLYGIVAPNPYILTDELGTNVPNFRTFKVTIGELQVAGYKGFSDVTAKIWIVILGVAIFLFIFNMLKSPKQTGFPVSLILCMGFSLVLHVLYGDDPMLYSPNWVYALVLFVASSFEKWADNKWLQLVLVIFLGMMIYTNLGLIDQILGVSLPYYGR